MESTSKSKIDVEIRPSVLDDCLYVTDNLREADRREAFALAEDVPGAVRASWEMSPKPLTVDVNGVPAAITGTTPVADGVGCIWMVGTDQIKFASRPFLRTSRELLNQVSDGYSLVFNYMDERNTAHIRWVSWLGFTFINRHERFGRLGLPFLEFVRIM